MGIQLVDSGTFEKELSGVTFICKRGLAFGSLGDIWRAMDGIPEDDPARHRRAIVRAGVVGWRGAVEDRDGNAVEFSPDKLDLLPAEIGNALAQAILDEGRREEDQKKAPSGS